MKLTKEQERVLALFKPGKAYTAYTLGCRMSTLWCLKRLGLIDTKDKALFSSSSFYRHDIYFTLCEAQK